MNVRVRAAVIAVDADHLLLVKHVDPATGHTWWIPPGGGMLPSDRSVHACAIREVREETGLSVQVGKLVYVREFVEVHSSLRHLELFFLADEVSGELTLANIAGSGPDEDLIKDVRWLSRTELLDLVVYPELLKHKFWEDWSAGFPEACYLGVSTGE